MNLREDVTADPMGAPDGRPAGAANDSRRLLSAIRRRHHQGLPPSNLLHVLRDSWRMGQYMLKHFGPRSWYTFWFTKLFVADEGGEYDLLAPFLRRFPNFLKSPQKIEIEHTTVCDKRCVYCSHTHFGEKQQLMPFHRFASLVDAIPSLKWVNIAGIGSFFIHPEAIEILRFLRRKHLNVNFVDEFDFLTVSHAEQIVDLGVNSIYVSFDAARKETYEAIKKGCRFDRALSNIRALLKVRRDKGSPFPVLHFRFLVTRRNYMEMPDFIDLVAGLGDRGARARVEFIGLIAFPGIESEYIAMDQIPEAVKAETFRRALSRDINLYFSHTAESLPSMSRCVRWSEPFVLVNGEVISDCAILMQHRREALGRYSLGNAFERPFPEIWNSAVYRRFRGRVVDRCGQVPDSCANCCVYDTRQRAARHGMAPPFRQ